MMAGGLAGAVVSYTHIQRRESWLIPFCSECSSGKVHYARSRLCGLLPWYRHCSTMRAYYAQVFGLLLHKKYRTDIHFRSSTAILWISQAEEQSFRI